MEKAGHKVYFAWNGEEAVKIYLRKGIQVVVTDLQMPHVDGQELITELLALFPDTPIIAVSGEGEAGLERARAAGATEVLSKPVDLDRLTEMVAEAAESPGASRDF